MNDQILDLAAAGKSQREIAAELSISVGKVNKVLQKARHARVPGDGSAARAPSGAHDHKLDRVDLRTLGALRVFGSSTARDLAAFILEHSKTDETLEGRHVEFITASLDRLAALSCSHHCVIVDGDRYTLASAEPGLRLGVYSNPS
jgi:hypothetical protein